MDKDIKSIIVLLATQAMINLGEIKDPITGEGRFNLEGAEIFIKLLTVLTDKTKGNLTDNEEEFLNDVRANLETVHLKKINQSSG